MRLTCPNCDAQYEVPDEVVPTEGRDVQCSNCGQTWFQHHPDHAPEEEEDVALGLEVPDPDEEVSPPPPPEAPEPEPVRRQLDPAVADILRQEAEAEFEARQQRQAGGLESQPDLGLDDTDPRPPPPPPAADAEDADERARAAKRRMARMRGEPDPGLGAAAMSSRRELLPDIEEINSTLRNDGVSSSVEAATRAELGAGGAEKKKRGFRRGFMMVLMLAVVLAALYIFAPQIAEAVPTLAPMINSYVALVDQMRLALDGQIKALLTWLDTMATNSAS